MQSELQGLKRQLEHVALQREHYRGLAQAVGAACSVNHSAMALSSSHLQGPGAGGHGMVAGQNTAVSQGQQQTATSTARRRVSFETWTGDVANLDAGHGGVGVGGGGGVIADTPMRAAAAFAVGSGVGGWVPSAGGGKHGATKTPSSAPGGHVHLQHGHHDRDRVHVDGRVHVGGPASGAGARLHPGVEAAPGDEFRPPSRNAGAVSMGDQDAARVSAVSSVGGPGSGTSAPPGAYINGSGPGAHMRYSHGGVPGSIAMESPSPWTTPATRAPHHYA